MPTIDKEKVEDVASTPTFRGGDEVTVLFGYGKEPANKQHHIDNYTFVGGVGRNIPYSAAKHWQDGTRPDGTPVISHVKIQAILPNTATETDFVRATGIKAQISDAHMAALVNGMDVAALVKMLSPEQAKALAAKLSK